MRLQLFDLMDEIGVVGSMHLEEDDVVVTYLPERAAVDWLNT